MKHFFVCMQIFHRTSHSPPEREFYVLLTAPREKKVTAEKKSQKKIRAAREKQNKQKKAQKTPPKNNKNTKKTPNFVFSR